MRKGLAFKNKSKEIINSKQSSSFQLRSRHTRNQMESIHNLFLEKFNLMSFENSGALETNDKIFHHINMESEADQPADEKDGEGVPFEKMINLAHLSQANSNQFIDSCRKESNKTQYYRSYLENKRHIMHEYEEQANRVS